VTRQKAAAPLCFFVRRQLRMVQVWIEIHSDELMADWELAVAGDEPFRIAPLQ